MSDLIAVAHPDRATAEQVRGEPTHDEAEQRLQEALSTAD
jgi:hypothetical protein